MEGAGLVAILLAALAGYSYAVAKRAWSDHKKAKAGVKALAAKRWSEIATAIPIIVLLILVLRVLVEDM